MSIMGTYTVFDHTADIGIEVQAESLEVLLVTAARATFDQMLEDWPEKVEWQEEVCAKQPLDLEGDLRELLVDWLQELLYAFEKRRLVPLEYVFEVVNPDEVRADVGFGRFDPARHRTRHEIKAVTYHELAVRQEPDGAWMARFILDV
jgi:SHS2 domain-containing protein